ncbi:DUF1275 domain-containing protein [Cnuibacter physcomitrellae]|uniref:YoaK family protein n=1 Tax=Cnuibacter physcomitrellae TaxID=1619308 RepID=UPI0021758B68|nr:YoaK family protein [Cnuibacter physcomitrellae]MCS5497710.1 DUF1275 domain-containing protein [Cnuibacter physcomitrellae]
MSSLGSRRPLVIATGLSVIAGITDVTSWLLLGGFFSAHVTGNVVVLAADAVDGRAPGVASLLAVPVFIAVAAVATLVSARMRGDDRRRTAALLGAQAALLTVAAGLSFTTTASDDPGAPLAVVIGLCAVAAMAAQNAYLHLVHGMSFTTAVMTGNLVTATVSGISSLRDPSDQASRRRWNDTWPIVAGFIAGCVVGAAAAGLLSDRAAVVPAVLAIALLVAVTATDRTDVPAPA